MTTAPPIPAKAPALTSAGWWMVGLCAGLLALRKPWALHTPQFWAEDGEIFMNQDLAIGTRAFLEAYNGYLHLLPRIIAWIASRTADPAWWPAIYNWLSFAISIALFARMASNRIQLPGKNWLMLALVMVVGTGEVLLNVTNLQWVTAFFLVLQLFAARPTTFAQQAVDLVILVVVGLNGPFAILFLPLLAWRAWRERGAANFLAVAALAVCALIQGWLVVQGPHALSLHTGSEPFRPWQMLSIIGSRLVTWPFLGPAAAKAWPGWVHAALATLVILPLLVRAFRSDPLRAVRGMTATAFALITLACAYRARADTWNSDDLFNGDRYFYISRVLLAWLVILEFHAKPRVVAFAARGACVLAVVLHVPRFVLPAPIDYRWADHCDPIRRGVRANIYTLPEGWFLEYPGRPSR